MRLPARFLADHLVWSTDGGVWATWRVDPVAYLYRSTADKLRLHSRLRSALTVLPGDALLASVCRQIDPADTVAQMAVGVAGPAPAWSRAMEGAYRLLDDVGVFERRFYLTVRLPDQGAGGIVGQLSSLFAGSVGMAGLPPTGREIDTRRRQATQVRARLAAGLGLQPVAAAELRWLYVRGILRGQDPPLVDEQPTGGVGRAAGPLVDAVLVEGGGRDDRDRPRHRRYVRVDTETATTYQTVLVMSDMPASWVFPDGLGEWFAAVDQMAFPVDWAARVRLVPNADAQLRSRRQARQLTAQVDEYEGEPTGPPPSLAAAMQAVDAQRSELSASPSAPELQTTIMFALAAGDLAGLEEQAGELQSLFEGHEYLLPRPTGNQLQLLRAMLPGAGLPAVCRDYAQFLMPRDLASGMPIASTRVGDRGGMLLGYSLDGLGQPVLFDPAGGPATGRSGSVGVFGALGSGKSYMGKRAAWAVLARGGRVVALDRTASGEYARFAAAAPGRAQVVELSGSSTACLDPLAVFDGPDRIRYAVGFLSQLTGTSPTGLAGATLAEAVRTVAEADGRLIDVIDRLRGRADVDGDRDADTLARKLANLAREPVARLAFGDGDVLTMDADYIVLWTPGLSLPDRDELDRPGDLLPEQVVSQALLYLAAGIARTVAFADHRFAVALFDEAWSLTASPQGRALLLEGVRDGRKHNAAVWLVTQHPDDLGDDRLAELLGPRFVFRQSGDGARKACRLLGLDPDPRWIERLETDDPIEGLASGQCLFRDVRGRVGRIQVATAETPELAAAIDTTPKAVG